MCEIRENFEKMLFEIDNLPTANVAFADRAILRWLLAMGLQVLWRLKGQKRGRKRIATVSITFSFDPCARTKEEKKVIALVDGGNGLEETIRDGLECEGMTCRLAAFIQGIVYALDYLWVAANAIPNDRNG